VEVGVYCVLLPAAIAGAGGWAAVASRAPAEPGYWDVMGGWRYLVLLAPAFVISPGQLQKVYGARDDRAVRWGVGLNAALLLLFACVPPLLGLVARSLHPELRDHELALPTLLMKDLPPALGALGLAAAFTTDVNTADAVLFMLSTSLAQDLYRGFLNRTASDAQVLKVARVAAVAAGMLGVVLAIALGSVVNSITIFYTLLSVCLTVPILAGLFLPAVGTREAVASIAAGVPLTLAVHFATAGRGYGLLPPALIGITASALGCAASALARRARAR
jgi:SSS family solute:Na+ symporter